MIEKLDIPSFGSFQGYAWDAHVRENHGAVGRFKKMNVIFGRNYSGKTTLSRVFRSFEVGQTPARYDAPKFTLKTSGGTWTEAQLANEGPPIRVYNRDFVESNLKFLRDADGHITPFAILGSSNTEVEEQIAQVEAELGSKELGTGLRAAFLAKREERNAAKRLLTQRIEALQKRLVDKANKGPDGIKHSALYKDPYYDVRNLNTDIAKVKATNVSPLSDIERAEKVSLLIESALQPLPALSDFVPRISDLGSQARNAAAEVIQPSLPIQELLNSAVLAQWVKAGKQLHAERTTCAFCHSPLPEDLWAVLDKHFNEESEALQRKLDAISKGVASEKSRLAALGWPARAQVYSVFHERHGELNARLEKACQQYDVALDGVASVVKERSENIFAHKQLQEDPYACATELMQALGEMGRLIDASNAHTAELGTTQRALREELRLSEVSAFIVSSGLDATKEEITAQEAVELKLANELQALEAKGKELNAKLESLQAKLRDEKRGADRVNGFLSHSLGGTSLRLVAEAEDGQTAYRFRIMRGDQVAHNLSEGECSLVSFCYFLARLDDVNTQGKSPIIYIDDPISSLDSNHIFFIFSLIESVIAKPLRDTDGNELKDVHGKKRYRYEQLFISTHNLDFLKYLKRLSKPESVESFLIVKKTDSSSIGLMPKYLRAYITELNYLFGEIHTCVDEANSATQHHSFYNFGNNLRKFLEAFLFFRYPSSVVDNDERLRLFFADTEGAADLLNRLTNEHSHLEGFVDRGAIPVDYAEISRTALFVLKTMRAKDAVQYSHFLASVGANDPLPPA